MSETHTDHMQEPRGHQKMHQVMGLYRATSLATRIFVRGRALLSDLEFVESHVPPEGRIVDVGCGHGLFSNLMAVASTKRQVTGIDIDEHKISQARETVFSRANIAFIQADVLQAGLGECEAVTIVDVMYLLPPDMQLAILKQCAEALPPGGLLVWKAQHKRPRWKYAWTYAQEMAGTASGLTQGRRDRKLHFLSRDDATRIMNIAGFESTSIEMKTWRPYTDILYLGRRL